MLDCMRCQLDCDCGWCPQRDRAGSYRGRGFKVAVAACASRFCRHRSGAKRGACPGIGTSHESRSPATCLDGIACTQPHWHGGRVEKYLHRALLPRDSHNVLVYFNLSRLWQSLGPVRLRSVVLQPPRIQNEKTFDPQGSEEQARMLALFVQKALNQNIIALHPCLR